jgi:hypothetical protein
VVSAAISFGFGAVITAAFRPWGWGVCRLDWGVVMFLADETLVAKIHTNDQLADATS